PRRPQHRKRSGRERRDEYGCDTRTTPSWPAPPLTLRRAARQILPLAAHQLLLLLRQSNRQQERALGPHPGVRGIERFAECVHLGAAAAAADVEGRDAQADRVIRVARAG